ncbi:hypothetical protein E8E14_014729 [Neopestalotiopsis sp. 37M]|nr:hypothetical protein E8E14_014729 [Neopestalotiopsis sp. 37M]
MHPDTERELAHTLLIELLAHQFTYPVRWIETQEYILGDLEAERIVEVGPSNTLTNMMKRTWEAHHSQSDTARNVNRRILGPKGDMAEIYYQAESETQVEETPTVATGANVAHTTPQDPPSTNEAAAVSQTPQSTAPREQLQDIGVSPASVVLAIIATKLKKQPTEISLENTISNLVSGRSTLSNEIVGDLLAEFPSRVPEKPEELPLNHLCETLSLGHSGTLGKTSKTLTAKMISSKFPGDYGQTKVREILREKWGLGPGRQDGVLVAALMSQPTSRLSSSLEADAFLSELASAYYKQEGLSLPSSSPSQTEAPVMDAKALQMVNEQNASLIRGIQEVLGDSLGRMSHGSTLGRTSDEDSASKSSRELDEWLAEHGDEYADGIKGIFDAKKARQYDSYWNWNAQDIQSMYELLKDPHPEQPNVIEEMAIAIVNRTCDRSLAQLQHLIRKESTRKSSNPWIEERLQSLYNACSSAKDLPPMFINTTPDDAPHTTVDESGQIVYSEHLRGEDESGYSSSEQSFRVKICRGRSLVQWPEGSNLFAADLLTAGRTGFSFQDKNVLLTGAGKNSIGMQLLQCLLKGGARITVTTSSPSTETMEMYQQLYAQYGAKGSALQVVPFNQGSARDVQALADYLGRDGDGSWELDYIVPFAALSENGRSLEELDARSEIAHRMMLTNLLRLLGAVVRNKKARGLVTRPATVVLPLSPNHGLMGNDGLYSESKMSLEALLPKWASESWHEYLSMLGIIIGWTRGTGLMNDNDIVAQDVEKLGVRTFGAAEMAAKIAVAMGGSLNEELQSYPAVLDLGGGLGEVDGLKDKLIEIRRSLQDRADVQRAIIEEQRHDTKCVRGSDSERNPPESEILSACANIRLPLPAQLDYDRDIKHLASDLEGMVDLSRVVVITGFAELGPHGNSRTRWEMEAAGSLSLDGCVEMAWMMGLIKHHTGVGKDGTAFSSWVDSKTLNPVADSEVPQRYLPTIIEHSGIRRIEPDLCDGGYDPERKELLQELVLQRDLSAFETSAEVAEELRKRHGKNAEVIMDASGNYQVKLKAGATVMVPRSSRFDRTVAGQIPTGWSPKRYGISDDIIEQVDPVTLFSLICTVEALLCSGIVDPYEWYSYMHISELGIALGSSMGGLSSIRKMHRDRYVEKPVKGDVLQETFINTIGAWINMLLTSSAGPMRTPVGACATGIEALDTGCDLIVSRKAKVCIVGGVEDFVEDVSFEFGSMKATCNTDVEFAAGRTPREMSRPMASSRSGFVEAQGCGVQVLTSAELALKMGLPIFSIVAYANMAADKVGRSVPAPGKGVLTNAREPSLAQSITLPPLLDLRRRKQLLCLRRQYIAQQKRDRIVMLKAELSYLKAATDVEELERYRHDSILAIKFEAKRQDIEATFDLGNQFWVGDQVHQISPIRGSLATWGLGVDDITVASLHGTSTVQNDLNETMVIQEQLRHLGRSPGNLLPCVSQKWLTGHGKGAAGAWMLNGALQMMNFGVIPGNRNCDNVDKQLRERRDLFFPNTSIRIDELDGGVKACSITSFGFGQKGAQAIVVHPRYLFATISKEDYQEYTQIRDGRWQKACRVLSDDMVNENMVSRCLKTQPPYKPEDEIAALLDPAARY